MSDLRWHNHRDSSPFLRKNRTQGSPRAQQTPINGRDKTRQLLKPSLNLVHFPTIVLKKSHYRAQRRNCQGWRRWPQRKLNPFTRAVWRLVTPNSLGKFESEYPRIGAWRTHSCREPSSLERQTTGHSCHCPARARVFESSFLGCTGSFNPPCFPRIVF